MFLVVKDTDTCIPKTAHGSEGAEASEMASCMRA